MIKSLGRPGVEAAINAAQEYNLLYLSLPPPFPSPRFSYTCTIDAGMPILHVFLEAVLVTASSVCKGGRQGAMARVQKRNGGWEVGVG